VRRLDWEEIKGIGLGVLSLTHIQLFALTYHQFVELYKGWEERERQDSIKRAQLMATIINANRWDDKSKAITESDILPWYDEYVQTGRVHQRVAYEPEPIEAEHGRWDDEPLQVNITKQLLAQKGLEPDEVRRDSAEWREAEETAQRICGTAGEKGEDVVMLNGFVIEKADPKIWGGKPPWEDEGD
jgi:hypothetical protein